MLHEISHTDVFILTNTAGPHLHVKSKRQTNPKPKTKLTNLETGGWWSQRWGLWDRRRESKGTNSQL